MNREQKVAMITGVTGQDGSYLSEFLLNKGYRVIGIVRRSSVDNHLSRLKHLLHDKLFNIVNGDVTDEGNMFSLVSELKPDEFYNLAAQSHVQISFEQPNLTMAVNYGGVLNVLEAIRIHCPHTRFYQASTSEMFGKNCTMDKNLTHGGAAYQDEQTPFAPQSPYAIAKVAAHHLVQLYRSAYSLHLSCGILFNHESERRGDQFVTRKITKWIGEFIEWRDSQALWSNLPINAMIDEGDVFSFRTSGGVIRSFPKLHLGNIETYRDWGYAGDYVQAMWMMLQSDKPDDYVIATGESHTVRDFLTRALDAANLKGKYSDYIVQDQACMRPAEVTYLLGNSAKANRMLGWIPKVSFNDLVRLMVTNDIALAKHGSSN